MKVADLYRAELAHHGFAADRAQLAAVAKLDALRTELAAAARSGGTLAGLLRRGPLRTAPVAGGLYLWGRVGRGKTWLLDLFVAQLPPEARLRSHFHHFMRDVHQGLAALGHGERPLEQIAARIARGTRVLLLDELYVADIGDAMILHGLFAALLREGVVLAISSNWLNAPCSAGSVS